MKRVVAVLFALAVALPVAAADLPRPISLVERMRQTVNVHPSLVKTKAEKSRKGRPLDPLKIPATPQLSHSVRGQ